MRLCMLFIQFGMSEREPSQMEHCIIVILQFTKCHDHDDDDQIHSVDGVEHRKR